MKLSRFYLSVIFVALTVKAQLDTRVETRTERESDASIDTQTNEDAVARAPSSVPSPTVNTNGQIEDTIPSISTMRPRSQRKAFVVGSSSSNFGIQGSSCIGSITSRRSSESSPGHLDVRKNTKNAEACCEECRSFSGNRICRSWWRVARSGRCFLNAFG